MYLQALGFVLLQLTCCVLQMAEPGKHAMKNEIEGDGGCLSNAIDGAESLLKKNSGIIWKVVGIVALLGKGLT